MQHAQPSLPEPDEISASHSERVASYIGARIDEAGGTLGFAEYMHHALYAPGLGYYAAGATKLGAEGDFVTAPEVSPIFGRILARQCAEVLGELGGGSILEYGAGSGRLARDVLTALDELGVLPERYEILEVSADLKERQARFLRAELPRLFSRITWIDTPPTGHRGVMIANEVLDALPVERFRRSENAIEQLRVTREDGRFAMTSAPAPVRLTDYVGAIERALGEPLPNGYVSEASLGVRDWIGGLADSLQQGIAFLLITA